MAIATGQRQVIDKAFLNQRSAQFGEDFLHVEVARNRRGGSTLASKVTGLERNVGLEVQRFLAVFRTNHETEAISGSRALDAVAAKVAGKIAADDLGGVDALGKARSLNILQSILRNRAGAPNIPGNAVGVGTVKDRTANRVDASLVRIVNDVEGAGQAGNREVVQVDLVIDGAAVLIVSIVGPCVRQVTLGAQNTAIAGVLEVALTRATFNVATQDLRKAAGIAITQSVGD